MRDLTQIETRTAAESTPSPRPLLLGGGEGEENSASASQGISMNSSAAANRRELWRQALGQSSVWLRALKLGFTTGLLQGAVNQGDRWLGHTVDHVVVLKTIVSPLIGFTLVLFSAAATWVERSLDHSKL